jgi:HEPN domain-containing protein
MTGKEIRQITKNTFADQRSNKLFWYGSAVTFHEAARLLGQHQDSIHLGIRAFLTNAALSLELLLKAIIVAKGQIPQTIHKLPKLADHAGVTFTKDQMITLELLAEILEWRGRYPVPNREDVWDRFHDETLPKHVVHESKGNTHQTLQNRRRFPSIENYEALWNIADRQWNEFQLP